jgi:hypothetical protein
MHAANIKPVHSPYLHDTEELSMNADLMPDEPGDLEPQAEPDDCSDLDYDDVPCTDGGGLDRSDDDDESRWDAFIPDEDEWDPQPHPRDFWVEDCAVANCAVV